MRKSLLILILVSLFITTDLFAADGDLIVNGKMGIGKSPDTKYHLFRIRFAELDCNL
jgi:hypothetical protein